MPRPSPRSDSLALLGAALARLRSAHGVTQESLALACGVQRSYIAELERGRRNPSVETLLRIAAALDVSLEGWMEAAGI
jgi:transcriptional regulator with XRE-family HTH domain